MLRDDQRRNRVPKGREATNLYLRKIAIAVETQTFAERGRVSIENERNEREKERHAAYMRQVERQQIRQRAMDDLMERIIGRAEFYKERVLMRLGRYKGES